MHQSQWQPSQLGADQACVSSNVIMEVASTHCRSFPFDSNVHVLAV